MSLVFKPRHGEAGKTGGHSAQFPTSFPFCTSMLEYRVSGPLICKTTFWSKERKKIKASALPNLTNSVTHSCMYTTAEKSHAVQSSQMDGPINKCLISIQEIFNNLCKMPALYPSSLPIEREKCSILQQIHILNFWNLINAEINQNFYSLQFDPVNQLINQNYWVPGIQS